MNAPTDSHDGKFALKDEVLDCLLAATKVNRGIFHIEECGLNLGQGNGVAKSRDDLFHDCRHPRWA